MQRVVKHESEVRKARAPTVCTNCQTTITPLWGRDLEGQPLCMFSAYRIALRITDRLRP